MIFKARYGSVLVICFILNTTGCHSAAPNYYQPSYVPNYYPQQQYGFNQRPSNTDLASRFGAPISSSGLQTPANVSPNIEQSKVTASTPSDPNRIVYYDPNTVIPLTPQKPQNQFTQNAGFPNTQQNYGRKPELLKPVQNSNRFGQNKQGTPGQPAVPGPQLGSTYVQDTPPPLPVNATPVSRAITTVGVNFMKIADPIQGNVVFSPFSVATCLALLQQGAQKETRRQLTSVLHMTPEESLAAYDNMTRILKKRYPRSILKVATSLFTSVKTFILNPDFPTIAQYFASDIAPINFENPLVAEQSINNYVAKHTDNQIKELISRGSITSDTQMVLVNAVFFKGLWQTMFDQKMSIPMDFHLQSGYNKRTQFMRIQDQFQAGYDRELDAQIAILPFEGGQYSLMVILPTEATNVHEVVNKLDENKLLSFIHLPQNDVKLTLPKFTARAEIDLRNVLVQMGLNELFSEQADFTGIGISGRLISPRISSAIHSAVLSVDEQGATAAAASGFAAVALVSTMENIIEFKADRPYLCVLWDNELEVPIIMGKIEDPTV